jgi:hypothetical protein
MHTPPVQFCPVKQEFEQLAQFEIVPNKVSQPFDAIKSQLA